MCSVGILLLLLCFCFLLMINLRLKDLSYLHKDSSPHWWTSIWIHLSLVPELMPFPLCHNAS